MSESKQNPQVAPSNYPPLPDPYNAKATQMPLQLHCPYCSTPLKSNVVHQGQVVICPGCNAQVAMPLSHDQQVFRWIMIAVSLVLGLLVMYRGFLLFQIANQ